MHFYLSRSKHKLLCCTGHALVIGSLISTSEWIRCDKMKDGEHTSSSTPSTASAHTLVSTRCAIAKSGTHPVQQTSSRGLFATLQIIILTDLIS